MKASLTLAAVIAASLLFASAEAQPLCRGVSTCDSALATCVARRSAGMLAPGAPGKCEEAAAQCRKTGIWRGVGERGPYACRMPGR